MQGRWGRASHICACLALASLGCSGPKAGASAEAKAEPSSERDPDRQSGPDPETVEALESIGYLDSSAAVHDLSGVTVYDRSRTQPGLNLVVSGPRGEAILMDSAGAVLHRWSKDPEEVFPDAEIGSRHWVRARILDDGGILMIFAKAQGMARLDRNSEVVWSRYNRAHHCFDLTSDGEIYVLTRKAHVIPHIDPEELILEDFVTVLDSDGNEQRRVSLIEAMERSDYKAPWEARKAQKHFGDVFHTNSVKVLDGALADQLPAFRAGNLLVSIPYLHMIAVLDPVAEELVWALSGPFALQHDPTLLKTGSLLLFDNQGLGEASRILELEPASGDIVWEYRGSEQAPFYSKTRGTVHRLDNGNTLITETDNGRAFEVTPNGTIVWEYHTPHRTGEHDDYVAPVLDVVRLPPDRDFAWASPGSPDDHP